MSMTTRGEEDDDAPSQLAEITSYAIAKFFANLLASPVEVINILRQVEYAPSDEYLSRALPDASELPDSDFTFPESSDDDEDDAPSDAPTYFDPYEPEPKKEATEKEDGWILGVADANGYLVRTGNDENDPCRPPYQLSVLDDSVASGIGKITTSPSEGFLSLWKGTFADWLHDMCHALIQPSVEETFNDIIDNVDGSIPIIYLDNAIPTLSTAIASHAVTGFLLSPLEVVRTRLIVQTSNPFHRKYRGTFHCLTTMIVEEGIASLYWNRRIFPTFLYHTLQPLFKHSTGFLIERWLGIEKDVAPISYNLWEFAFQTVETAILLPLEVVRRRLDCQVLSKLPQERRFEGMVECTKIPYTGMIDCLGRTITEEGGRVSRRNRKRGKKARKGVWGMLGKVGALYRGFRLRIFSNFAILLLKSVAVDSEEIVEGD
ncbi:hypothetical protein HDV05_007213 [Chytridiales sp. JEL 0842]|nr:hypothetical protein HDV05_007213 [Chytridiales sp. JEL 0842]